MGQEQRLTFRLVDMWEQLAHDLPPPPYAQWNSAKISDIWHQCMVFGIEPSPNAHKHTRLNTLFVGNQLKAIMPNMRTGEYYQLHILDYDMKKLLIPLSEVIETQYSVAQEGTFVSKHNKIVKYRCCFLPFSDAKKYVDGSDNVHYVVAGFSWMQM